MQFVSINEDVFLGLVPGTLTDHGIQVVVPSNKNIVRNDIRGRLIPFSTLLAISAGIEYLVF